MLLITSGHTTGKWLREAFASDHAAEVKLVEAVGVTAGLTRLREEAYDTVLVDHDPPLLDALAVLDAIRTGTSQEQPVLVLGTSPEFELSALCFEAGADGYICLHTATTRSFLWQLARATERQQLLRENERLRRSRANGTHLEREEAERLIQQQRLLCRGAVPDGAGEDAPDALPAWQPSAEWTDRYRELLQAYIIMGSNGLVDEIEDWITVLTGAGWTVHQVMHLHLGAVEHTIQDLGCRSSRHVMNRANLLAMQILVRLCEVADRK